MDGDGVLDGVFHVKRCPLKLPPETVAVECST
jgi:hypothetical protein